MAPSMLRVRHLETLWRWSFSIYSQPLGAGRPSSRALVCWPTTFQNRLSKYGISKVVQMAGPNLRRAFVFPLLLFVVKLVLPLVSRVRSRLFHPIGTAATWIQNTLPGAHASTCR